ncbi:proprotein convertase P-domain-containing protein [Candidatus Micrarchaeota archaeon]|nr:proprotein convertase P-domain-containing protein [Candidatus Micrarchaeota archaeon]
MRDVQVLSVKEYADGSTEVVETTENGVHKRKYFSGLSESPDMLSGYRLPSEKVSAGGFDYGYSAQYYRGVPVYGAHTTNVAKNGKLVLVDSREYPDVSPSNSVVLSSQEASALFEKEAGAPPKTSSLVVMPLERENGFDYRFAWKIEFPFVLEKMAELTYFLDAQTGRVLKRENNTLSSTVSGYVTGSVYPKYPSRPAQDVAIAYENVSAGGNNTTTNSSGAFTVTGLSGNVTLYSGLGGPFASVENAAQARSNHSVNLAVPAAHNWSWNESDRSYRKEETNVFYHTNLVRGFFLGFNVTEMNFQMLATVAYPDYCNAYASGGTRIVFFGAGGGCEATSLGSDIIYHEYTHNVILTLYRGVGITNSEYWAVHEGAADYVAATITNDSMIGEEIFPSPIRYLNNTLRYSNRTGEPHDDGRIFAGALWNLSAAIGSNLTTMLLVSAMRMHGQSFSDYASNMIVADDDNANLTDGTPHLRQLCAEFHSNRGINSPFCVAQPPANTAQAAYYIRAAVPVRDYNTSSVSINVPQNQSGSIRLLRTFVNITHTWIGDLAVTLVSPNNTQIVLHRYSGGSADNLVRWYENESASASGTLDYLINQSPAGNWTLSVYDGAGADEGRINEFRLLFYLDDVTATPSPSPANDTLSISTGERNFPTSSTDTQTVGLSFVRVSSGLGSAFDFGSARTDVFYYITDNATAGSGSTGTIFYPRSDGYFAPYYAPNSNATATYLTTLPYFSLTSRLYLRAYNSSAQCPTLGPVVNGTDLSINQSLASNRIRLAAPVTLGPSNVSGQMSQWYAYHITNGNGANLSIDASYVNVACSSGVFIYNLEEGYNGYVEEVASGSAGVAYNTTHNFVNYTYGPRTADIQFTSGGISYGQTDPTGAKTIWIPEYTNTAETSLGAFAFDVSYGDQATPRFSSATGPATAGYAYAYTASGADWTTSVEAGFVSPRGSVLASILLNSAQITYIINTSSPSTPSPSPTPSPTPTPAPAPDIIIYNPLNNSLLRSNELYLNVQTNLNASCYYQLVRCGQACEEANYTLMQNDRDPNSGNTRHWTYPYPRLFTTNSSEFYRFSVNCTAAGGGSSLNSTVFYVNTTDVGPPWMSLNYIDLGEVQPGGNITITAWVQDDTSVDASGVSFARAQINYSNGSNVAVIDLFDDGLHYDGGANDSAYANVWSTGERADYRLSLSAGDNAGNNYSGGFSEFSTIMPETNKVLLMNGTIRYASYNFSYSHARALSNNSYQFDTFSPFSTSYDLIIPPYSLLSSHKAIVWEQAYSGLDERMQQKLMRYLNSGGKLFISGQDVSGYNDFYTNYLRAIHVQDDTDLYALNGTSSDVISDGLNIRISGGSGASNQNWPSEIDPLSGAVSIFQYDRNATRPIEIRAEPEAYYKNASSEFPVVLSSGSGGVRYDNGTFKTVYLSFGFEAIADAADRNALMGRIMNWFYPVPNVSITSPANTTYDQQTLLFSAASTSPASVIRYSFDWQASATACANCSGFNIITAVPDGFHSFSALAENELAKTSNQTIYFAVDTAPPLILIANPQNASYNRQTIPFDFAITDSVVGTRWAVYSVDGGQNVTLPLEGSLRYFTANLSVSVSNLRYHNITVYANDSLGHYSQQTIFFTLYLAPPTYNGTVVSPSSPQNYSLNQTYRFNSSWVGEAANVSLELDGVNHSAAGLGSVFSAVVNRSPAAGVHNYSWHVFDSAGNYNRTQTETYTVNKANPDVRIYLNGTVQNLSSEFPATINVTYYDGVTDQHLVSSSTNATLNGSFFTPDQLGAWYFAYGTEESQGRDAAPILQHNNAPKPALSRAERNLLA